MYLTVAVSAIHANDEAVTLVVGVVKIEKATRVRTATPADICVALLTQLRTLFGQQGGVVRPVYTVAQRAVFGDRVVLPEKRTTLFRMTDETVVIDAHLTQFCRT